MLGPTLHFSPRVHRHDDVLALPDKHTTMNLAHHHVVAPHLECRNANHQHKLTAGRNQLALKVPRTQINLHRPRVANLSTGISWCATNHVHVGALPNINSELVERLCHEPG